MSRITDNNTRRKHDEEIAFFNQPHIHAGAIVKLLSERHTNDIFVPECKDGPTWSGNHLRLDAWAMKRSWAHLTMTGYEVKVSRQDFVHDTKWPSYLPLCNEFYFAAPRGIIQAAELPAEVGLLEVASTGTRLFVRKKAPHRQLESQPCELLIYLLMCRMKVHNIGGPTPIEYWRQWLQDKKESRELGYQVSRAIRVHCSELEMENIRLRKVNENLEAVRSIVAKLGLNAEFFDRWNAEDRIKRALEQARQIVPQSLLDSLNNAQRALAHAKLALEKFQTS